MDLVKSLAAFSIELIRSRYHHDRHPCHNATSPLKRACGFEMPEISELFDSGDERESEREGPLEEEGVASAALTGWCRLGRAGTVRTGWLGLGRFCCGLRCLCRAGGGVLAGAEE